MLSSDSERHCLALVLSGGGSKGAYQAGALKGLINGESSQSFDYDVVVGISTGARQGYIISAFAKEDSKEMADYLVDSWASIDVDDLLTPHQDGEFHLSKYDTQHQQDIIKDVLTDLIPDGNFKRKYSIGVTEMNFGPQYRAINMNELPVENRLDTASLLITAAGAIPFIFESLEYEGNDIYDGGLKKYFDIEEAIQRCSEVVSDESDIVLDLITLSQQGRKALDGEISWTERFLNNDNWPEIVEAMKNHPKVQFRYLMVPETEVLKNYDSLNVDPDYTFQMIEQGRIDAKEILKEEPGARFQQLLRNL